MMLRGGRHRWLSLCDVMRRGYSGDVVRLGQLVVDTRDHGLQRDRWARHGLLRWSLRGLRTDVLLKKLLQSSCHLALNELHRMGPTASRGQCGCPHRFHNVMIIERSLGEVEASCRGVWDNPTSR